MADDTTYGCAAVASEEEEEGREPTQVTRLLKDLDECLESSKANLDDAGKKADRLTRRVRHNPRRVKEMLTPIPPPMED